MSELSLYTIEERRQIVSGYKELLYNLKGYAKREELESIKKAFRLALKEKHGEYSRSGRPAIFRVLDISNIVVREIGLDNVSVVCSLLYEPLKKRKITETKIL